MKLLLMEPVPAQVSQNTLTMTDGVTGLGAPSAQRGDLTILVVDDEPGLCRLCSIVLQRAGYQVIQAHSATSAQGLWHARSAAIDLVITDFDMPGPNGLELCAWLHVENPRLGLILMSGSYADNLPIPSYVSFLPKPFTLKALTDAVQNLIQQPRD